MPTKPKRKRYACEHKFSKIAALNADIAAGINDARKEKRKLPDTVRREGVNLGDFWNPTCKRFVR